MSWPPPESFWPTKLYIELPDGVDHIQFRRAVEAAVAIYKREAPANIPPWEQIVASFDRVLAEARRLNSLWAMPRRRAGMPCRAVIRLYELEDVQKGRANAAFQLQLECELADKRRERLYDNLIIACAGAGRLPPSASSTGPMTKVLKAILDHVIPHAGHQTGPKKAEGDQSLTASAVKKIIKRHLDRRGGKVLLGGADYPS
jgi:hypothetical protein